MGYGGIESPHIILEQHAALHESPQVVNAIKGFQEEVIVACLHTIRGNQTNAIITCKLR